MSERAPVQNKTSATPPQATQACSPLLHRRPLTDELSESLGSNSNISKELGGIQPKTIRRSLNWQNISVEAPSRSNGMSLPGGIQRQQQEQEETPAIEHQVSAKKAETSTGELSNLTKATEGPLQPKVDRGRLNWGNISVEAPTRSGEASPQPIQRQQEEQQETPEIQTQMAADSAEKTAGESSNSTITSDGEALQPKIARVPFNGRNIPVEAPQSSAASNTYPEGIQRLETSGVKEQEKSTESLQMQPLEEIQAKSSSGEPQEKEEQNQELVQTKLTVGAPGDKYEQEADSMAAKVMTMPDSAIQQPIQRQTDEETEAVQMQPLVNSITPLVQRQTGEEEAGYEADTEPPENYQGRRDDASVGEKVEFLKHRKFRAERRYRRQLEDNGGGRNVYLVSQELPNGNRVKILSVSQPPGSLPSGHEEMDESALASMTKVGHSEAVHHRIEENYPELLKDATRRYEATTREQCGSGKGNASCRYLYPPQAKQNFYGYPYSAPEDHIHNDELRNKVISNKKNNQGQTKGLSKTEKQEYKKADTDAKWARQNGPDQNKALNEDLKNLGQTDSATEYSSDEDPIYLSPTARNLLASHVKQLGKAPLFDIPAGKTLSEKEMADQKQWVKRQKEKQNNKRKNPKTLEQDTNKKQRTEGSAPVQMKPGLQQAANGSSQASPSIENRLSNSKGAGSPLPDEVRSFMEPRFGADFSGVRVHTDSNAVQMNKELGAQAFAHGSDIYFGAGKSPGNNELTAHELTHTIQQGAAGRMNKEVRRQPQQEGEQETVQAKEISISGQEKLNQVSLSNKETSFQASQPETETLAAKALSSYNTNHYLNKELRQKPQEEEQETTQEEPIQAKQFTNSPSSSNKDTIQRQSLGVTSVSPRIQGDFLGIGNPIDKIKGAIAGFAKQLPGYSLLTLILGKDPISDTPVQRNATNLIRGMLGLVPNGANIFNNLQQSGTLQKSFDWFNGEVAKLNLTGDAIKGLFGKALKSLGISDALNPMGAFEKVKNVFVEPIGRIKNFAVSAGTKVMEFAFEGFLNKAGGAGAKVMGILRKAGGAFSSILKDPVGFCGNLVGAVRGGCQKFSGNAATHLKNGLTGWLFGALAGAGLTLPAQFDTKGIVSVVLQVLGATYERLRGKLANKIGGQKVGRLEKTFDFLRTIVTGGLGTAWQKISEFAGNLQEMVIGGIKEWVMQSVITSAITKLISMFNPAGAIVQAAMAIYNTVMFFIERGSQIAALAEAVFNSIGTIAAGNVAGAANYVEQTIGRSLPVMISFLARLLGLGGVSEHIKNVIKKIQTPIENAMNKLANFIVEKGKSLLGKDKDGKDNKEKGKKDKIESEKKHAEMGNAAAQQLTKKPSKEMSYEEIRALKEKEAKTLEDKYNKELEKPVKMTISFKAPEEDKKDGDMDFHIHIGPNDYDRDGTIKGVSLSPDDGTQKNPFPLIWPKPASANYPTLYFAGKTNKPLRQSVLLNMNMKGETDENGNQVKAYEPHSGGILPGGDKIGISSQYQISVGKVIGPLSNETTPGGGKINDILKQYGFRPKPEYMDGDHVTEIQMGGQDVIENLWPLDASINRSAGATLASTSVEGPISKKQVKISDMKENTSRNWYFRINKVL